MTELLNISWPYLKLSNQRNLSAPECGINYILVSWYFIFYTYLEAVSSITVYLATCQLTGHCINVSVLLTMWIASVYHLYVLSG